MKKIQKKTDGSSDRFENSCHDRPTGHPLLYSVYRLRCGYIIAHDYKLYASG